MTGHSSPAPLDTLYRRFGANIHRRACELLGDAQDALDVMQDTFLAYMGAQASLRGEARASTVLYQIATHKAVDRLRRNARWSGVLKPLEVSDDDDSAHPGTWATSLEGDLKRVEAKRDLALLTDGEPPQVLTAAFLHFVEGHNKTEVGDILDLDRREVAELLRDFAERARKRSARLKKEDPQ